MVNSRNMRYNPYWYQGLDYVEEDPKLANIDDDIDMHGHAIVNLKDPVNDQDAASKKYVDDAIAAGGAGPGGGPLQASQIHSQAYGQIQATNVQDAIQEIADEVAFLGSDNVFSADNVFDKSPQLSATAVPSSDPKALASIGQVTAMVAARPISAGEVTVDQTTPLTNLTGTNVQEVVKQADTKISELKEKMTLVGTYDVDNDMVLSAIGAAASGGIIKDNGLPSASNANANMYLIVKTRGSGGGVIAPAIKFEPGDIIYSNGIQWDRLVTSITTSPITASTVPSTPETNIKATNVQAVIKEISDRAAFKDLDNTFSKPIKLDANVTPTDPEDLATVKKVNDLISNLNVEASNVSVSQNPALTNLKGTDVQAVIAEIDNLFGTISDNSVDRTSFVGLYDAKQNIVTKTFAGADSGKIVEGKALPSPDDTNKNMFLYVIVAGKWTGTTPETSVSVGDFLMSAGDKWFSIPTGGLLTASDISVTTIAGVAGNNVQEVLHNLVSKPVLTQASNITVAPSITELSGANVQEVLTTASVKIKENKDANTALSTKVDNLDATQVAFDNSAGSIPAAPGTTVDTVQKAVEGLVTKINNPAPINATNVTFSSGAGINGNNVAAALDELKTEIGTSITGLDNVYVKKDGGILISDLDAGDHKITKLADPADSKDAANKNYVDTKGNDYVTKTGGQLTGDLNAGRRKITDLADPINDTDAVNKRFFVSQADDKYVKRSGGQLDTDLNANSKKIINLADPTENHHAANRMYVTSELAKYVKMDGGQLASSLDANRQKIINLADGTVAGDAINKGQLDDAINSLQSQLTGKLTFAGTYNAQTNTISSVNQAIAAQFKEYVVGQALPEDNAKFTNHFWIVTTKGTGSGFAPNEALNVGDLIYSSGSGWGLVPLGKTTAASNVSVDPITQLPGVSDVQTALQQIASRPAGSATASTTTFTPAGNIVATNVQDALEELDTEKAADDQVVKLTGNQTVAGVKTFSSQIEITKTSESQTFKVAQNSTTFLEWKDGSTRYCYVGFGSSRKPGAFQFFNSKNNAIFEFNKVCRYEPAISSFTDNDLVSKQYCDTNPNFVKITGNQKIDGTKQFAQSIELQLNSTDSKFDFLSGDYTPQQDPVRMSLIKHTGDAHGAFTRVFGFDYDQEYYAPVGVCNFVLKLKNTTNSEYFWFRLSHKPNFNDVKCYVSNNKLSFHSMDVRRGGIPDTTNNGVILAGVANATEDTHALNRRYADGRYVRTDGTNQTIQGIKTFGSYIRAGYGAGFLRFTPEDNSTKTLYFSDTSGNQPNRKFNIDLDRKSQLKNLVDPTNDYDAAHKKYVDDKTSNGLSVERVQNVDVTAAVASLANKGSLTFSYRLTRDPVTQDVLSALFGMKLTLTSVWNPGSSTTPVELPGCHIAGEDYYKGLPVVVDTTLTGGGFKTVAQIRLVRVVPDGGVNQPQSDAPIEIGRVVCKIDGGNTKLYAVFSHNADITVPTGTGAFFTVRYEGLPSMTI